MKIKKMISFGVAMLMAVAMLPADIVYAAADNIEIINADETAGSELPEVDNDDLDGNDADMSPDFETEADTYADEDNAGLAYEDEDYLTPDGDGEVESLIENIPKADGGYVYLGGKKWRIIGMRKDSAGNYDKWLLISSNILGSSETWEVAKNYCSDVYDDTFSYVEKTVINKTNKTDADLEFDNSDYLAADLKNADLFLLSAAEALTYFADNDDRTVSRGWWLRSPKPNSGNDEFAGVVWGKRTDEKSGSVHGHLINDNKNYYARPAFVINLSSVLFTSAQKAGKPEAVAESGIFRDFDDGMAGNANKKLTLHDSSRDGFAASVEGSDGKVGVIPGGTLKVNYEGAVENEAVSAMLFDSNKKVTGYASMVTASASGTWQLSLPDDLEAGEEYSLKAFSEQQNGADKYGNALTDYASNMVEITLSVKKEKTPKASFVATGADSGFLTGLVEDAEYYISGAGISKTEITASSTGTYEIESGLSAGELSVVKKGTGENVDSAAQPVTITKVAKPSGLGKTDCTNISNNDGTITGVDTTMRYRKEGSDSWKTCTGNEITGLSNGKYYIQQKYTGAMLASDPAEVIIEEFVPETVAAPAFSPAGGTYTNAQNVTIKCATAGAKIYYTTDGSRPTTGSKLYSGAIKVSKTTTIKAIAVKDGMTDSRVTTATYTIKTQPEKKNISTATVSAIKNITYTGKKITPKPTVKFGTTKLTYGTDYNITYRDNINAGTAKLTITGKGKYKGSIVKSFKIDKAAITISVKKVSVKAKKLKNGDVKIKASEAFSVTKNKGDVAYEKKSGSGKIAVSKKGKVTIKKGTKKGTYKVKVKVKAAGDRNHKKANKTVTLKITVK